MSQWHESPPFVVIEGLDGAGTTTQSRRLVERLRDRGHTAVWTEEPSGGPIGALLRQMLAKRVVAPAPTEEENVEPIDRDALALMFAADRIDHLRSTIDPALEAGHAVVSDRYYPSNFAYQGTFEGDDDTFDWIETLNERARPPDLTVFLEASAELCLERLDERRERDLYEDRERLESLERAYRHVVERLEQRDLAILRLDASRDPDLLSDAILEAVIELEDGGGSEDVT